MGSLDDLVLSPEEERKKAQKEAEARSSLDDLVLGPAVERARAAQEEEQRRRQHEQEEQEAARVQAALKAEKRQRAEQRRQEEARVAREEEQRRQAEQKHKQEEQAAERARQRHKAERRYRKELFLSVFIGAIVGISLTSMIGLIFIPLGIFWQSNDGMLFLVLFTPGIGFLLYTFLGDLKEVWWSALFSLPSFGIFIFVVVVEPAMLKDLLLPLLLCCPGALIGAIIAKKLFCNDI